MCALVFAEIGLMWADQEKKEEKLGPRTPPSSRCACRPPPPSAHGPHNRPEGVQDSPRHSHLLWAVHPGLAVLGRGRVRQKGPPHGHPDSHGHDDLRDLPMHISEARAVLCGQPHRGPVGPTSV